MTDIATSITAEGQMTIPTEERERLGIGSDDTIVFRIEHGEVKLVPARFTLRSAFGSVEPRHRPEHFEEMIREAKEEKATRTVREMKRR
jgi:AbrB family looped-hinge helix DNA binding protein